MVENLSNTVVAPEVSEAVSQVAEIISGPTGNEIADESLIDDSTPKVADVTSFPDEDKLSREGFDFEHFFDDGFGQNQQQPPHNEPAVKGLKNDD